MCDQLSDLVLDAVIAIDKDAKVACESCVKDNYAMIFGEITTTAKIDFEKIVREKILEIGYDDVKKGIDGRTCEFVNKLGLQSQEIADGVHLTKTRENMGAGDQGLMFGYATNETEECMPITLVLSHKIMEVLASKRKSGEIKWLRPDAKSQVTFEYENRNGE